MGGPNAGGGRRGVRPARHGGVSLLLGAPAGGVSQHAGRHAVHAGKSRARSPDPRRPGDVRAGIFALADGHGGEHLPAAPAPRPLGRAAAREDHGRDPAVRRARAALLLRRRLRRFEEYLATGWTLIGTADEVRESLQQDLEATGLQGVMLLVGLPGLATPRWVGTIRLFRDEVCDGWTPVR